MAGGQEGFPSALLPFCLSAIRQICVLLSMSDMNTTQVSDAPEAPVIPSEPAPPIHSRFLFVDVAALRAKQLRRGARPRLGENPPVPLYKAERVAMEEVRRGLVSYDIRPPASRAAESEAP